MCPYATKADLVQNVLQSKSLADILLGDQGTGILTNSFASQEKASESSHSKCLWREEEGFLWDKNGSQKPVT